MAQLSKARNRLSRSSKVVRNDANALTDAVLMLFNLKRFCMMRVNAGGYMEGGRYVKMAPTGTPDIIGYCPKGCAVAIEIKVGRDKLRPEQAEYIDRLNATEHGRATVVHNLDEAIAFLATFDDNH